MHRVKNLLKSFKLSNKKGNFVLSKYNQIFKSILYYDVYKDFYIKKGVLGQKGKFIKNDVPHL